MAQTVVRVLPGPPVARVTTAQGDNVPARTRPSERAVRRRGHARSVRPVQQVKRSGAVTATGTSARPGWARRRPRRRRADRHDGRPAGRRRSAPFAGRLGDASRCASPDGPRRSRRSRRSRRVPSPDTVLSPAGVSRCRRRVGGRLARGLRVGVAAASSDVGSRSARRCRLGRRRRRSGSDVGLRRSARSSVSVGVLGPAPSGWSSATAGCRWRRRGLSVLVGVVGVPVGSIDGLGDGVRDGVRGLRGHLGGGDERGRHDEHLDRLGGRDVRGLLRHARHGPPG